jgi:copper oxidase (laccase) domain-containing protein
VGDFAAPIVHDGYSDYALSNDNSDALSNSENDSENTSTTAESPSNLDGETMRLKKQNKALRRKVLHLKQVHGRGLYQ